MKVYANETKYIASKAIKIVRIYIMFRWSSEILILLKLPWAASCLKWHSFELKRKLYLVLTRQEHSFLGFGSRQSAVTQ